VLASLCVAQGASGDCLNAFLLNDGRLAVELRSAGVEVHVAPESEHGLPYLCWRLRRLVMDRSPDIVHAHRYKEVLLSAAASARGDRPALVRTIHGRAEQKHGMTGARRRVTAALEVWVGRRYLDAVVCVSEEMRVSESAIYGTDRVHYVPNGIQVDARPGTSRPTRTQGEGLRAIAFCGRLVPVKRVDIFIAMAERLAAIREDVTFVVIGDGPMRAAVEHAMSGPLRGRLQVLGYRSDAMDLLRESEILVLTSDAEGMPMAVLEAMAAGAVVVSRPVGAVPEVLDNGAAGVLVGDRDPNAFARAIERVLDNPAWASALRTTALERVRSKYSASTMRERYGAVYGKALVSNAHRRSPRN
jgi:glycosyltransferase involved in cell wall biosynthesis